MVILQKSRTFSSAILCLSLVIAYPIATASLTIPEVGDQRILVDTRNSNFLSILSEFLNQLFPSNIMKSYINLLLNYYWYY